MDKSAILQSEKIEHCGIVGAISKSGKSVAHLIYHGMLALQHRGQDSAGMAIFNGNTIKIKKAAGLVSSVFSESDLMVEGHIGIGHTRYRTIGLSRDCDIQPFGDETLCIAHNGQITNYEALRSTEFQSEKFESSVDSELFLHAIRQNISEGIEQSIRFIMDNFNGAFSTVALVNGNLIVFRDKYGLRPLVYGENSEFIGFASESCALNAMDLPSSGDVFGGELIIVNAENIKRKWMTSQQAQHCMFEYVYFSRSDSRINGVDVFETRQRLGRILAEESPVNADVVVGIPDTARIAAYAFAEKLGIPCEEGLIKNRYFFKDVYSCGSKEKTGSG